MKQMPINNYGLGIAALSTRAVRIDAGGAGAGIGDRVDHAPK